MSDHAVSRRTLTALAAAGVGLPLLAACSSDDSGTATDSGQEAPNDASPSTSSTPSTTAPTPSETASSAPANPPSPAVPEGLTTTSDIEVGGGAIFADQEVVVTQPTKGEFKAFSAVCTHQGCLVASISDGTINCDCHGSRFSIGTGEPESGPATSALGEVTIAVTGDRISLA
jgi:Rieske Fe-S protein